MALFVQQQLRAAGIDVRLELTTVDEGLARVSKGDFDAWLADVGIGPGFLRQNLFWHSGGPFNWGRYSNPRVDEALDAIRHASDESQYRSAVAAFQSAMVDDPPAIFLAWSERARAVSARFDVYQEPGRDILNTLRLWRPANVERVAHN
jgi:peptide/nickel transport system substrate-binding protein